MKKVHKVTDNISIKGLKTYAPKLRPGASNVDATSGTPGKKMPSGKGNPHY